MADRPRYIRSGVRPYPWGEKEPGLHAEDLDGDEAWALLERYSGKLA